MKTPTELAFEYGQQAYRDGKNAVPAQDKNVMGMIKAGSEIGTSIPLFKAWLKGWHSENAKEIRGV